MVLLQMNKKIITFLILINLIITSKVCAGTFPNPPLEGPFIGDIIARKMHEFFNEIFNGQAKAKYKNIKSCDDFYTQKEAQDFFEIHGGPAKDPYGLDPDHDGAACGFSTVKGKILK